MKILTRYGVLFFEGSILKNFKDSIRELLKMGR